jgi:hypothetical protein
MICRDEIASNFMQLKQRKQGVDPQTAGINAQVLWIPITQENGSASSGLDVRGFSAEG